MLLVELMMKVADAGRRYEWSLLACATLSRRLSFRLVGHAMLFCQRSLPDIASLMPR